MKVLVSSHIDTVFKEPYARTKDGLLIGACDNFASAMAVGRIIEDEEIIFELTENEEMFMDGARYVTKRYSPEDIFIVVLDVTKRAKSWKKNYFSVENWNGIDEKHIKRALAPFKKQYRLNPNGEESEAWLYKEMGFACLEIDIPISGGLHSLDSTARISDILLVPPAVIAIKEYVKERTRIQLSDIYRVNGT